MVKRFQNRAGTRGGVNLETGGAAQLANQSQQLIRSSTVLRNAAGQLGAQAGFQEAQEVATRDDEGNLKPLETRDVSVADVILSGGKRTAAYNKTLRDGYMAGLEVDIRNQVGKIANENIADVTSFNEQAQAYRKATLQNVDASVRNSTALFLDQQIGQSAVSIQGNEIQKNEKMALANTQAAAESALQSGMNNTLNNKPIAAQNDWLDYKAHVTSLREQDIIGDEQEKEMLRVGKVQLGGADITRQIMGIATEVGTDEALLELDKISQQIPKDYTVDEWTGIIQGVQARVGAQKARVAGQFANEKRDLEGTISDLQIKARSADFASNPELYQQVVNDTNRLFNERWPDGSRKLPVAQRTAILANAENRKNGQIESANRTSRTAEVIDTSIAAVQSRMNGNPEQILTQKDVDRYYDDPGYQKRAAPLDDFSRLQTDIHLVNQTKIVPTRLKNQMQTWLHSEDPALMSKAMMWADSLDEIPGALDAVPFTTDERAFLSEATKLLENLEPKQALELARRNTDPSNAALRQARTDQIEKKIGDRNMRDGYAKIVEDHFTPGMFVGSLPEFEKAQMVQEYQNLFEAQFTSGMAKDDAKKFALRKMGANWKVSGTTGEMMKYRPDEYYAVGGGVQYIQQQAADAANIALPDREQAVRPEQIRLVSTEETAKTAAFGQPVYQLMILEDSGTLTPVDIDNNWWPDIAAEEKRLDKLAPEAARAELERNARFFQKTPPPNTFGPLG